MLMVKANLAVPGSGYDTEHVVDDAALAEASRFLSELRHRGRRQAMGDVLADVEDEWNGIRRWDRQNGYCPVVKDNVENPEPSNE